ncbi:MAG: adenosine deaminase [Bacteroides sp. SM23_62_1]|nr:MAG: adenosine deaminase [Bacteroides sp. SM23_62_1]
MKFTIAGNIVDIFNRSIYPGTLHIADGQIKKVIKKNTGEKRFIIPGLVDAHVHIESSMLIPSEFARIAVRHGTVAVLSDPHEIANVLGKEGVKFMIGNGEKVPFKFYFGAPSCVPATDYETSGAKLELQDIDELFRNYKLKYLSEVMNFPGVIHDDKKIMDKILLAKSLGKKIDGHAPGLRGKNLIKYALEGITTDHECANIDEAREKIGLGIKILIREGSAAKNFNELIPLIKDHPDNIMFCSDDLHPDDLIRGNINLLIRKGLKEGYDLFDLIKASSLNPVLHYDLDIGLLREGDKADFIVLDALKEMKVKETFINGIKVFENGNTIINKIEEKKINIFNCTPLSIEDILVKASSNNIRVIKAYDGQLFTDELKMVMKTKNGFVHSDIKQDVLKIVVYNRYHKAHPAVGFINGFGLKKGAIATSVAHDSHNIIAIGVEDKEIIKAINRLIEIKGGIVVLNDKGYNELALPIGGLMTDNDGDDIARKYQQLNEQVKKMGSHLNAPFMTLSFMALLVIPKIKISDKGLFDVEKFSPVTLFPDIESNEC